MLCFNSREHQVHCKTIKIRDAWHWKGSKRKVNIMKIIYEVFTKIYGWKIMLCGYVATWHEWQGFWHESQEISKIEN
jgi:hypothetical protein